MEIKIVKILRKGKKTCSHFWHIGTEWQVGTKHSFIRVCHRCGCVQEIREVGRTPKNKERRFSSSEVAEMLGISKKWLYILEQTKKIPRAKRDKNNFRYYNSNDLKRIKKIREKEGRK